MQRICFFIISKKILKASPSITYSAHLKYTKIWKYSGENRQLVIKLQISPSINFKIKPASLITDPELCPNIDPNTSNSELEWLYKKSPQKFLSSRYGVIIKGFLLQNGKKNSVSFRENKWWSFSADNFGYEYGNESY